MLRRRSGPELTDGIWARLVDVPGALSRRRYTTDVDVVLDVTDPFRPATAGRWRLVGGRDGATCRPTDAAPQLGIDVRELGSACFGGITLAELAGAGLVRVHDPAVLDVASVAFTSAVAPHCGWIF